ncbi:MAG TPA: TolC family protein [Candidatus Kapabacteria bacterium]
MRYRFLLTLSVILVSSLGAASLSRAQTPASQSLPSNSTPTAANIPQTITLDIAIKAAEARNYTVRTANNATRIDQYEVTRAKDNMWLPTVSATASWGYGYAFSPAATSVPVNPYVPVLTTSGDTAFAFNPNPVYQQVTSPAGSQTIAYGVSAGINLFNGGSDLARINAAESNLNASQNTSFWTRQQTAFTVTSDYLNILRNEELIYAADTTLAEALAQLGLVQGQYQAGVVPIGQVYTQQAVVSQDSLLLIQNNANYQNAKTTLLFELNVPPDAFASYSFNADGVDTSTSLQDRAAVDTTIRPEAIDAAIDKRPDILAQVQAIKAGGYDVDITRGALWPQLNASLGIGGNGIGTSISDIHTDNSLSAGLSLTIPIFDKFQNELLIDEEKVDVENDLIRLEQDVQQVRSDAATAVNNLRASDEALDATSSALTAAEESFRLAEEQLRVGAGTEVNVVIAEAAVETARTNRVNAKYNWVLAQRQLAYTLGTWNY